MGCVFAIIEACMIVVCILGSFRVDLLYTCCFMLMIWFKLTEFEMKDLEVAKKVLVVEVHRDQKVGKFYLS